MIKTIRFLVLILLIFVSINKLSFSTVIAQKPKEIDLLIDEVDENYKELLDKATPYISKNKSYELVFIFLTDVRRKCEDVRYTIDSVLEVLRLLNKDEKIEKTNIINICLKLEKIVDLLDLENKGIKELAKKKVHEFHCFVLKGREPIITGSSLEDSEINKLEKERDGECLNILALRN